MAADITDARLQGPDWAVTDLDLSLRNLTLSHGGWQSEDGTLSMNASEFIYGSLHLFDPILNAEFSPWALRYASSPRAGRAAWCAPPATGYAPGTPRCSTIPLSPGWVHAAGELETAVDDAAASSAAKPDAEKFSASRNLIIDVDPAFPWQITALDGYGGELQLVKTAAGEYGTAARR